MQVHDQPEMLRHGRGDRTAPGSADVQEQLDRTAHGQAVTSRALARLQEQGWLHLDDLHWPGRARAVIDHVAVGPGGIVVLLTVNWIGTVEVHAGKIHHNGRPSATQGACENAAEAVRGMLPAELRNRVVPALSVVTTQPLDGCAGNVLATSVANLEAVLNRQPTVLDEHQVAHTAAILWANLSVGGGQHPRQPSTPRRSNRLAGWWRTLWHRRS
ncbi:hypothetical protein BH18ACT8_BH18ACT8_09770 [soil metagenome]